MNNLINITTNEQGSQVVDARELHKVLEVTRRFDKWVDENLLKSPFFEDGVDYILMSNIGQNSRGGRPRTEYALTLDMAKELSMIQHS